MRTFDANVVNHIVNTNPKIMESIQYDPAEGPFDLQPYCEAVFSCILMDNRKDAAAFFHWSSPQIWQAHTVFGTTCRGRAAINTAKDMLREMFTVWDAEQIWGQTPIDNRAAHWFNRQIGAEYLGEDVHHTIGDVLNFRIRRDDWLLRFG